jgi:hypothetical protein
MSSALHKTRSKFGRCACIVIDIHILIKLRCTYSHDSISRCADIYTAFSFFQVNSRLLPLGPVRTRLPLHSAYLSKIIKMFDKIE